MISHNILFLFATSQLLAPLLGNLCIFNDSIVFAWGDLGIHFTQRRNLIDVSQTFSMIRLARLDLSVYCVDLQTHNNACNT